MKEDDPILELIKSCDITVREHRHFRSGDYLVLAMDEKELIDFYNKVKEQGRQEARLC